MTNAAPESSISVSDTIRRQVNQIVGSLQASRDKSPTVATLAHLRANLGVEPGVDPRIWDVTIAAFPGAIDRDEPTPLEFAVHGALTLYAHHQRALSDPMHAYRGIGLGLGGAVRQLESRLWTDSGGLGVSPVRRRFDAATLANDLPTLLQRMRSLVGQLRDECLPLDYARLAVDFYRWQFPDSADSVRRQWARQYYRMDIPVTSDSKQTSPASSSAPTEEN